MDAAMYTEILESTLLEFLQRVFPGGHRFQQDNAPSHTARHTKQWLEEKGVTWWQTTPESPDCNPIENLWHELKEYIRREIKPKTKSELIDGIESFWRTVDIVKCKKYIGHLRRVLPRVTELGGLATGF